MGPEEGCSNLAFSPLSDIPTLEPYVSYCSVPKETSVSKGIPLPAGDSEGDPSGSGVPFNSVSFSVESVFTADPIVSLKILESTPKTE